MNLDTNLLGNIQWGFESAKNFTLTATNDLSSKIGDGVSNAFTNVSTLVTETLGNEFFNTPKNFVSENAMNIGYGTSVIGGYLAADSIIQLLRNDANTNHKHQISKLLVGGGLLGASLTYAASDDVENTSLKICALSIGLAKAIYSAAIPPLRNRVFVFKAAE